MNTSANWLFEAPVAPAPVPGAFVPVAVETPGGGRIRDKRPPDPADLVALAGVGGRRIMLHHLAAGAATALVAAARAAGLRAPLLLPVSGFRDPERQAHLWQEALRRYGSPEEARRWVAPPGHSAHQSGRAIDFYLGGSVSGSVSKRNVARLRATPAYRWLAANAARFGFYPYGAEPWHWEYNPPRGAAAPDMALSPHREDGHGAGEYEFEYTPSATRLAFEAAVRGQDWRAAYLNLNGLSMYEMLRALDSLSPASRDSLWAARDPFTAMVNMPRIAYAWNVVFTRRLPPTAPSDLGATGQVRDTRNFLAERRRAGPTAAQRQAFLSQAVPAAQATKAEFGVPTSVTLAQAIIESGWGQHHIGGANNYFGIKAQGPTRFGTIATGAAQARTREVVNGASVMVNAWFRAYNTMTDSFRDHGRFLRNSRRYQAAFDVANNPDEFARRIARAGYATDPGYANALLRAMRAYNLYQYD